MTLTIKPNTEYKTESENMAFILGILPPAMVFSYPVIGAVKIGGTWVRESWQLDGCSSSGNHDLIAEWKEPDVHEMFVNFYKDNAEAYVHNSKESAKSNVATYDEMDFISCLHLKWTDGHAEIVEQINDVKGSR